MNNEFSSEVASNNSTKQSRQLKYYYLNREKINENRRIKYKASVNSKKNNKIEKSNDVLYNRYSVFDSVSKEDINLKKPFLSFFDMLTYAQSTLIPEKEDIKPIPMKTSNIFVLPEIVDYITFNEEASFGELERFFKDKVSKRQMHRAVQRLVNLKWLIRRGKNDFTIYYPNPFLISLFEKKKQNLLLSEFARLKTDFFDLLNLPLINVLRSKQKMVKSEVKFHKFTMSEAKPWVRAWFYGYTNITLQSDTGKNFQTYLPVNFHASAKIEWANGQRTQNPYGFPHNTLPLAWILFDVFEGRQYTKKARVSRRSKEVGEYEYIHFDNSINILHYNLKTDYGRAQYLMFKKPFDYAIKKWNNESCEYVEVSSFELLEKLFNYRFVDNKRGEELFDCLGLEHKPISGRPKKK